MAPVTPEKPQDGPATPPNEPPRSERLRAAFESARDTPARGLVQRLGQILLRDGVIDTATIEKATEIQSQNPTRKFGEILVEDLSVDHHTVFSRLAEVYAFKSHAFDAEEMDEERLDFVRQCLKALPDEVRELAMRKRVIPLRLAHTPQEMLVVVTPDPMDRDVLAIVPHFGHRRTEICYGRFTEIESLVGRLGPVDNKYLEHVEEAGVLLDLDDETEGLDETALDAEINQSMLTNLVEGCLVEAVRRGASDVHIVPQDGNRTEFHFRVDGRLQVWYVQDTAKPEAIAAVVKDRARGVDRFERDSAQDGFLQREIDGHLIRFRVSILPVAGREPHRRLEDIVIRILDDRKVITDLKSLGLQEEAFGAFRAAIQKPQGMVILTGPTGSGKSTTLNAALQHVATPQLCVLTVEDPVEYVLRGARQIKIGPHLSFENAVRTILRHDPDIVMVGEIRDTESAETAVKLANTGHLTFTTLHTNDAPSAVARLFKMGIEPFLIASSVNIVLAQRLVPLLCPACKEPIDAADPVVRQACLEAGIKETDLEKATLFQHNGCTACNWTGFKGRIGVHEALPFTREIRQLILSSRDNVDEEAIRQTAVSQGMMTLRQSGLARVVAGQTTLKAVLAATMAES